MVNRIEIVSGKTSGNALGEKVKRRIVEKPPDRRGGGQHDRRLSRSRAIFTKAELREAATGPLSDP